MFASTDRRFALQDNMNATCSSLEGHVAGNVEGHVEGHVEGLVEGCVEGHGKAWNH